MNGDECQHLSVMPTVSDAELEGLEADEVRQKFPRFSGTCPECGRRMILYASALHYIAGDW